MCGLPAPIMDKLADECERQAIVANYMPMTLVFTSNNTELRDRYGKHPNLPASRGGRRAPTPCLRHAAPCTWLASDSDAIHACRNSTACTESHTLLTSSSAGRHLDNLRVMLLGGPINEHSL